ncbi:MAG: hypothetical protein IKW28_03315 [Lachnospiraceae bacterium]|nr:hypothetical protein [Lachnospiraceae bacterium]
MSLILAVSLVVSATPVMDVQALEAVGEERFFMTGEEAKEEIPEEIPNEALEEMKKYSTFQGSGAHPLAEEETSLPFRELLLLRSIG